MKLFAPEYYKDFVCIADRCKHSCCVGWEIDVDKDTLEKYKKHPLHVPISAFCKEHRTDRKSVDYYI